MVATDPGVLQASLVQAGELVFVRALHIALVLVVLVTVYGTLDEYPRGEAPNAIFCCQGSPLLLVYVHLGPLWAVGGVVAVVDHVEFTFVVA